MSAEYENHIYGCERSGCDRVGTEIQEWRPGYGYHPAYYCTEHLSVDPGARRAGVIRFQT